MRLRNVTGRVVALALLTIAFVPATIAMADPLVPPQLHTLSVTANGVTRTLDLTGSSVDTVAVTAAVQSWVGNNVSAFAVSPVNATRRLNARKRRVDFTAPRNGSRLDMGASVSAMTARLLADANETTPSTTPLALPVVPVTPKITGFANTIMVVQSRRKIYLYRYNRLVKTYRCAVGVSRYPTPYGTFYIGRKVKMPSWHNGGMTWAANMPSYIGPGPNNPLGTRAMYVYGRHGDTGVRFHGVPHSEDWSIGHAASHGCMRMHRKDVEDFFKRVNVGTTVYIIR